MIQTRFSVRILSCTFYLPVRACAHVILAGDVYVPALWQALLLKSNTPYPVLVFSHGLGGNRTSNTSFCVELASQGFVVAAIEHR